MLWIWPSVLEHGDGRVHSRAWPVATCFSGNPPERFQTPFFQPGLFLRFRTLGFPQS